MSSTRNKVVAAWSVHAFTLTGVIWATLATIAVFDNQPRMMWLFLGIALIVDALDGTLARRTEVKKYAPHFDGVILDSIIDYLTWTFIPALFLYRSGLLGEGALGVTMLIVINLTSMFCYANTRMKTSDNYFMGFPAAWNIVALALWILDAGTLFNVIVVIVFSTLTWAPITFVHPLRVAKLMPYNIAAAATFIALSVVLVITHPVANAWVLGFWFAAGIWILLVGVIHTIVTKRAHKAQSRAEASTTL